MRTDDQSAKYDPTADTWKKLNVQATEHGPFDLVEHYPPGHDGDVVLAQQLHDDGLLWLMNRGVLHPLGLAAGVSAANVVDMRGEVRALTLNRVDDESIEYGDEAAVDDRNVAKLVAAGHNLPAVADRLEELAAALRARLQS